ncbi:MAG TPA: PhoU family transcriptional regulator [Porphyromonadaceae bacterium]|jgi:phosphate transport system protein|nr:PhoU family transcriptional regulator [Porphyromonadaceae bacterium]HBL34096.1 PhoU family transcriptional regulator [Porphyromonadaceae bacterium]HCM19522.1 PhoU family transcriptional regulator [Porphyromonadaceae bacterium]
MNTIQQPNEHTSGIKDKYLDQLESDFQLLTEIVLTQMTLIAQLLDDTQNPEYTKQLKRNEKIIDSLDITIKEKVINAIILFTPRAVDLRKLMAYHDMTISMERVGDLIQNIVEGIQKIDFSIGGFTSYKKILHKMFERTDHMLKNAVFAFSGVSNEMAYDTILMDDKVDKLDRKIEKKLADGFKDQTNDSQTLLNIMSLNSISYYIERIGDKAVDIAESAIYLIEGKDVRHTKSIKKASPESEEPDRNDPETAQTD